MNLGWLLFYSAPWLTLVGGAAVYALGGRRRQPSLKWIGALAMLAGWPALLVLEILVISAHSK